MRITSVRTTVVGTPWRDLVFVELETDIGLVGVGEVRPLNKTDSFVAVVGELAGRYVIGAIRSTSSASRGRSSASSTGARASTASRPSPRSTWRAGT